MYILDAIPLTNIPRPNNPVFTYFYPKPLGRFSLVWVPVAHKKTPALVLASKPIKDAKQFLRKLSSFALKEVSDVIQEAPVLWEWQFELAQWLANYYWSSLGVVVKKFVPDYVTKRSTIYDLRQEEKTSTANRQRLFLFPDMSFFGRVDLPKNFVRVSSSLSAKKEYLLFQKIATNETQNIVGTRGVLFVPFNKLKEIHIFEEADSNHKSWEQWPKIHAVKVAQKIAQLHDARIIYHCSLPSVSLYAKHIQYQPLDKPTLSGPVVTLVDLTQEKLSSPFSSSVVTSLREHDLANKQVILYVNRRGQDRVLLCRDCGFVPHCPNCSTALVLHNWVKGRPTKTLLCHHCGYQELPPTLCSQCGSHQIRSYGFGTERVEQELKKLFSRSRIYRLDSDHIINNRMKRDIVEAFLREGNFLVTTSMLFSVKEQPVSLVVALSPDNELAIPDFAQNEKLFFNLWRLRRWTKEVLSIQTYNPESLLMSALVSGDWPRFYDEELSLRKTLSYPPFSSIIKLTYEHKQEAKAAQEAQALYDKLASQDKSVQLLGPAPAFLSKLKGKFRYVILIKLKTKNLLMSETSVLRRQSLKIFLLSLVPPAWDVDVDPIDSL